MRGWMRADFLLPSRAWLAIEGARCPCGGIGRRARLKIVFRKEWGFDSLHGHHHRKNRWRDELRIHIVVSIFNRTLKHFRTAYCSKEAVFYSSRHSQFLYHTSARW